MKWIIRDNYEEMSQTALDALLGYSLVTPYRVNMAITAGTTPKRMYQLMVPTVKGNKDFENIHYYNFDEIPHKVRKEEGVTMTELRNSFFTPAEIPENRIHVLNTENYTEQDQRILEDGGMDVILLGIGADGHYCGNLPGTTTFGDATRSVNCDEKMKTRISRHFSEPDDMPDFYVTMGPRSIMNAKNLILFASGKEKAGIMKTLWDKKVDPAIPATLLTLHPSITFILDQEAASQLG